MNYKQIINQLFEDKQSFDINFLSGIKIKVFMPETKEDKIVGVYFNNNYKQFKTLKSALKNILNHLEKISPNYNLDEFTYAVEGKLPVSSFDLTKISQPLEKPKSIEVVVKFEASNGISRFQLSTICGIEDMKADDYNSKKLADLFDDFIDFADSKGYYQNRAICMRALNNAVGVMEITDISKLYNDRFNLLKNFLEKLSTL